MASSPTLDQKRATHAWNVIRQVAGASDKDKKEFKTQAKKLPTRILTAGLGPALAFLEAKRYAPLLREALSHWVNQLPAGGAPAQAGERLLLRVIQGDGDFLRFATAECLAYLQWLVRFADAEFHDVGDAEEV